jgi:hypothetical protein
LFNNEKDTHGCFTDIVVTGCGTFLDLVYAIACSIEIIEYFCLYAGIERREVVCVPRKNSKIVISLCCVSIHT